MFFIPQSSVELIHIEITHTVNGVSVDPTADVAYVGLQPLYSLLPTTWLVAAWTGATVNGYVLATIIDARPLGLGDYQVYVKILEGPEAVVLEPGILTVAS